MARRWLVTLVAMLVLGSVAAPAAAQQPTSAQTEQPMAAQQFVDSVGVVTHFRYTDTSYVNSAPLLRSIQDLGVRHVRDGVTPTPSAQLIDIFRSMPQYGLRLNLVVGSAGNKGTLPPAGDLVATVASSGLTPDVLESIESANEWDLKGGPTWVADLQAFQKDLYTSVHGSAQLKDVPVVGPSAGRKARVPELTGMAEIMDIANLHNYANGGPPENNLALLDTARANAPGKPLYVTEMGYHTALNQNVPQLPVSETAKGGYLVRTLLENFRAGVARTYIYQLVDERAEPERTNQENHFGLLRSDLSRTPAYEHVQSLMRTLADPGPSFTPRPVSVGLSGDLDDVQHVTLQKRDGTSFVVLWRRGSLFDNGSDVAQTGSVRLELDSPKDIAVTGARGIQQLTGRASYDIEMNGAFAIAQIGGTLPAPTTSPAALPTEATATPAPQAAQAQSGQSGMPGSVWVGLGAALVIAAGAGGVLWWRRRVSAGPGDV